MHAKVDAGKCDCRDQHGKKDRPRPAARRLTGRCAPDQVDEQAVEAHSRHRVTGGEAQAGLGREAQGLVGARAGDDQLDEGVEQTCGSGTQGQVKPGMARSDKRCDRDRDGQKDRRQHQTRDLLDHHGEDARAQRDHRRDHSGVERGDASRQDPGEQQREGDRTGSHRRDASRSPLRMRWDRLLLICLAVLHTS